MNPHIILRINFLSRFGVKIDFDNEKIQLEHIKLKICSKTEGFSIREKLDIASKIYNQFGYQISDNFAELIYKKDSNISNIGVIPNLKHEIILKESAINKMPPFRIPLRLKAKTTDLINQLIKDKIIRPINSTFASAALSILKRNEDVRLLVNNIKLNNVTQSETYVFPRIGDLLAQ